MRLIICQQCEKLFFNNADVKSLNINVHEYKEYYNLYPCEDCGFMGGDATEIEEHSRNHRKANTEKSYGNFYISNGDIVVDENSDADKDWETTKEDENCCKMTPKKMIFFNVIFM